MTKVITLKLDDELYAAVEAESSKTRVPVVATIRKILAATLLNNQSPQPTAIPRQYSSQPQSALSFEDRERRKADLRAEERKRVIDEKEEQRKYAEQRKIDEKKAKKAKSYAHAIKSMTMGVDRMLHPEPPFEIDERFGQYQWVLENIYKLPMNNDFIQIWNDAVIKDNRGELVVPLLSVQAQAEALKPRDERHDDELSDEELVARYPRAFERMEEITSSFINEVDFVRDQALTNWPCWIDPDLPSDPDNPDSMVRLCEMFLKSKGLA